jgi:hypothetical protein
MICSSVYRLFFMPCPPVQFTRELQFYLAEFSGGTSLQSQVQSGADFNTGGPTLLSVWLLHSGILLRANRQI